MSLIDVRLAVSDAPVLDLPVFIKCREHDDSSASLACYSDHIVCYGCGYAIRTANDALAYLLGITWMELKAPDKDGNTIRDKYTMEKLDAYRERASLEANKNPLPQSLAGAYTENLWEVRTDRIQWLLDRGLSEEYIIVGNIGHDSTRFTIPFFNRQYELVTIRFRRDDKYGTVSWDDKPIPKYSGMSGRNGLYLYGEHWLTGFEDHLVVCEGELDALRLRQEGLPAVSVTNGASNLRHVPKLLKDYPNIKRVYVCGDNDEPGIAASTALKEDLTELGYRSIIMILDKVYKPCKDVTEYLLAGGKIEDTGYEA